LLKSRKTLRRLAIARLRQHKADLGAEIVYVNSLFAVRTGYWQDDFGDTEGHRAPRVALALRDRRDDDRGGAGQQSHHHGAVTAMMHVPGKSPTLL
jgi:hypothetical protein